ncbi:MAG: ATP-binding protein [Hyphomonadaceae bacterium]|nr:ATP-binding protein [Hyphomonadaceae bacterium]
MARNDLLINLIQAGVAGDRARLRSTVEAIAAEERSRKHTILADRLMDALSSTMGVNGRGASLAIPQQAGRDAILEVHPSRRLEELTLPNTVLRQVDGLVEEQLRADLLRAGGVQPRHRVLLSGPPGNGKTTLAEAIAERLAIELFVVRYDTVIASLLGETNTRLKRLFDYVRTTPCVLFFDEFDTLGKERGDPHETGEIKRVVSNLLLQIDTLPSYVVVIAATNHAELLDRAVWRRFQLRLSLPAPTPELLQEFFRAAFAEWREPMRTDPALIAEALYPLSFSEAREFCLDVRRRRILEQGGARNLEAIIQDHLDLWRDRVSPESDAIRPVKTSSKARSARSRKANKGSKALDPVTPKLREGSAAQNVGTKVRSPAGGPRTRRQRHPAP